VRVVAVDWSGRVIGEQRHLWVAEVADGQPALLTGCTRAEVVDMLLRHAETDSRLVVGLDFSFSIPAWFLAEAGIAGVDDLWSDKARLEAWLSGCEPPFWGRPGRRCPPRAAADGWRATELAASAVGPRPRSVFQIGGAGAVGTASLRGFPALARLRAAGFSIWPFDPPDPPVVFEVWPRHHYGGPLVKSSVAARARAAEGFPAAWRSAAVASDDAFDAAVTALVLSARTADLLATPPPAHPLTPVEGWIWGVPVPEL
jgi:hypothetical protein